MSSLVSTTVIVANGFTGTKLNTNAIRTTFSCDFPSLIERKTLPYAHALAQKLLCQNQLQIAGRLKHFYQGREVLARDQSISTIAMGYQIPFLSQTNQEKLPRKLNSNQKEKRGSIIRDKKTLLKKRYCEQYILSKEKRWEQQACRQLE